jgi:outer membrane lipoprotein SlyB
MPRLRESTLSSKRINMKKQFIALVAVAAFSAPAFAADTKAVLGGAIGGGAGAGIGSAVGGTSGAVIGGALGGAAGAALATSGSKSAPVQTQVVTREVVVEKEVVRYEDRDSHPGRALGHKKHKHGH